MRVVVAGAGYAGTIAANRLAKKVPDAEITVVNPLADFVEKVRLHEQIAGTGRASAPLGSMLRDGITTHVGTVDRIGDGNVVLDDAKRLDFDHLFLAVGSTVVPMPGTVPVGTWEGAEQARSRVARLGTGDVVTVIGGGLTGIETASELAGARPELRVRLVGESIATSLAPGARQRVRAGLERLGVDVVEDTVVEVRAERADGEGVVRLGSGTEFASALTLWAVMASIPELAARSGLEVNGEGRAVVDEFLRSVSDPRVFVVGDCAAVPGARLCCATAAPQGAHAADTLARMIKGRTPRPYSMGYAGQILSLGRTDGLMQAGRRDGTTRRLYFAGRVAAVAKEYVSRYAKYGSRTANYAWIPGAK